MIKLLSDKRLADNFDVSVSTIKRLRKTDPRFPRKVRISNGRGGTPDFEADAYARVLIDERDAAQEREATG